MSNWWKYSALRFYILNAMWNYKFWLNAKKVYDVISFNKKSGRLGEIQVPVVKKRFKGYLFKGSLYLDNPGIPDIKRDVWEVWKKKGLIK